MLSKEENEKIKNYIINAPALGKFLSFIDVNIIYDAFPFLIEDKIYLHLLKFVDKNFDFSARTKQEIVEKLNSEFDNDIFLKHEYLYMNFLYIQRVCSIEMELKDYDGKIASIDLDKVLTIFGNLRELNYFIRLLQYETYIQEGSTFEEAKANLLKLAENKEYKLLIVYNFAKRFYVVSGSSLLFVMLERRAGKIKTKFDVDRKIGEQLDAIPKHLLP